MKTLSVLNPISYLICSGIKDVENRSWITKYRGRILIHSSGNDNGNFIPSQIIPKTFLKEAEKYKDTEISVSNIDSYDLSETSKKLVRLQREADILTEKENKDYFISRAIIGEVTIKDIVKNYKSVWAEKGQYHWILENPVLYEKPIIMIKGRLGLWEYKR